MSENKLWDKQAPSRIQKPEPAKPAPKPAAKKKPAPKKK